MPRFTAIIDVDAITNGDCLLNFVRREPDRVGVRMGVRRGMGRGHIFIRRRRAAVVQQGIRRDLL